MSEEPVNNPQAPRKAGIKFGAISRRQLLGNALTISIGVVAGASVAPAIANYLTPSSPATYQASAGDVVNPKTNPVLKDAHLVPVFLGNWAGKEELQKRNLALLKAFISKDTNRPVLDAINSYNGAGTNITLERAVSADISGEVLQKGQNLSEDDLDNYIRNFIDLCLEKHILQDNQQPVFFLPFELPITSTYHFQIKNPKIAYSVIAYPGQAVCEDVRQAERQYSLEPVLGTNPNFEDLMNHWFGQAVSHEVMEMITDPYPATDPGWVTPSPNEQETGDLCTFNRMDIQTDYGPVTIQAVYSDKYHACVPYSGFGQQGLSANAVTQGDSQIVWAVTGGVTARTAGKAIRAVREEGLFGWKVRRGRAEDKEGLERE